jgi:hypothetical protein
VARIIRAAKQGGASEVIVPVSERAVIVRIGQSTTPKKSLEQNEDIVL